MKKVFLDVRHPDEFINNGITNSINIPHYMIMNNLSQLSEDSEIFVYCQTGIRAELITKVLESLGFNVTNIKTINHAIHKQHEIL
jgi:rhodanese-related sulfurtransferase